MSAICAKISKNQNRSCLKPLIGAVDDDILLINYEDWINATFTFNVDNPKVIETISLPSGAFAYRYQGNNNSPAPKVTMNEKLYGNDFTHEVGFPVFGIGPDSKQELELLEKGRVVAILKNLYKGIAGECAYEVYGNDAGLKLRALVRDPNNADNLGAYDLLLQSSDKAKESGLAYTIFNTDFTTTKAIVDALVAAD